MSISRYVPENSQLVLRDLGNNSEVLTVPYDSVVEEIALSRLRGAEEIAPVPLVIYRNTYKIHVSCKLASIRANLPEIIDPKRISLQFFQKKEGKKTPFIIKHATKRNRNTVEILGDALVGDFFFRISDDFCSSKQRAFLDIALRVHDIILENFVLDLAVFTKLRQLPKDGKFNLGDKSQTLLNDAFWFGDKLFTRPLGIQVKREREYKTPEGFEEGADCLVDKKAKTAPSHDEVQESVDVNDCSYSEAQIEWKRIEMAFEDSEAEMVHFVSKKLKTTQNQNRVENVLDAIDFSHSDYGWINETVQPGPPVFF